MPIDYRQLRTLTAREIIAALLRDGFFLLRQRGSHQRYQHPDGRKVTVPFHGSSRPFSPGTLRTILFSLFSVGPNPRTLDAERKLLETLAARLTWESQGTVGLFSERIPCPSCAGVIQQFRDAFPHIRLVVTHGPGQK